MLISYGMPEVTGWAIAGTGASFITDEAALTNGRPADATRMQWTSNPPTISDTVTLTATLASAINARCAAFLLPNILTAIPAGVKIELSGKLSSSPVALGGNALTQRTALLPNGAAALWAVFPSVSIDTFVVKVYNDKSGATWATASQYVDLGEAWCGKGADFATANDIETVLQGGLTQRQSHNNQAWPLAVKPYRQITANLVPMDVAVMRGPNPAQDDFETVANAIGQSATCVIIPKYIMDGKHANTGAPPPVISTATIDEQGLVRTAALGVIDQTIKISGNGQKYYTSPIVFGETPP